MADLQQIFTSLEATQETAPEVALAAGAVIVALQAVEELRHLKIWSFGCPAAL